MKTARSVLLLLLLAPLVEAGLSWAPIEVGDDGLFRLLRQRALLIDSRGDDEFPSLLARSLQQKGFSIETLQRPRSEEIGAALQQFKNQLGPGGIGFLYDNSNSKARCQRLQNEITQHSGARILLLCDGCPPAVRA